MKIKLKNGKYCFFDKEDYKKYGHIFKTTYRTSKNGHYVARSFNKKVVFFHRFILNAKKGEFVDHINGNILDNRKDNLRIITHQQNMMNRKIYKNNKCGYKGVTKINRRKPWRSQITYMGKQIHIGTFFTKEEAYFAYLNKANELFGEYRRF